MSLDPVTGMAYLGTFGFLADVAIGLRNARRIKALEREVQASVAEARARGERIEARSELLMAATGVRIVEEPGQEPRAVFERPPGLAVVAPAEPAGEFAHGGADPSDARQMREEKADLDAVAEERIRAGFIKNLGEEAGALAFEYAKKNRQTWRRAVRAVASGKFEMAQAILAPSAERYQVKVTGGEKAAASAASSELPF